MLENHTGLKGPVVIVGQPRSGSTILTRYINELEGTFIINDFYVLQKVDGANLWGELSSDDAQRIARWIYRILEIRCTQEIGKTLEQPIHLDLESLAQVKALVLSPWPVGLFWFDVFETVLGTAARLSGATIWGWNTPQDHLHLGRIYDAYPDAKIIAQLRKPEAVLSSYKNVHGWWHDARRYNPVAQALAWKKSARSILHWKRARPQDFIFLSFEQFVAHTDIEGLRIARFLDLPPHPAALDDLGSNSSFSSFRSKKSVTDLEVMIARKIIGDVAEKLEFKFRDSLKPSFAGIVEIGKVVRDSISILMSVYLFDPDKRKRILNLLKR